jgi:preprotein translocase subunit YajC
MNLSNLLLPLIIVLFAVPLYLGTRKQRKAVQQQQAMQSSLSFGDRVMTTSGMHATVVSTSDDTIDLEIAPGVVTTWLRAAVREKVADVPAYDESDEDVDSDDEYTDELESTHEVSDEVPTPESNAQLAPPLEESSKKSH